MSHLPFIISLSALVYVFMALARSVVATADKDAHPTPKMALKDDEHRRVLTRIFAVGRIACRRNGSGDGHRVERLNGDESVIRYNHLLHT